MGLVNEVISPQYLFRKRPYCNIVVASPFMEFSDNIVNLFWSNVFQSGVACKTSYIIPLVVGYIAMPSI